MQYLFINHGNLKKLDKRETLERNSCFFSSQSRVGKWKRNDDFFAIKNQIRSFEKAPKCVFFM